MGLLLQRITLSYFAARRLRIVMVTVDSDAAMAMSEAMAISPALTSSVPDP
jgi:hypothetical protein